MGFPGMMRQRAKGWARTAAGAVIHHPWVYRALARVFRETSVNGKGSNECLKEGFLPLPVHFYSPVPDIGELEERDVWNRRSPLSGIDFRGEAQRELLQELGAAYSEECRWPRRVPEGSAGYHIENMSFSYGCAASTHAMIRRFRPRTVIEIGSGLSSRVISEALRKNAGETGEGGTHVVVDPYPSELLRAGRLGVAELVDRQVERLDPAFFDRLGENDILFIDSGHTVKTGGDVTFLFLDVLPRLAPGVIVHVHDIALPREYPKVYITRESFRMLWTEQYLLQAFLCFNREFEVLLAMCHLMMDHADAFRRAFPAYDPDVQPSISGSFWIRRKRRTGAEA